MHDSRYQLGYPLATLFVLVAVCAILAAMLGPAIKAAAANRATFEMMLGAAAGSMIWFSVIGLVVGLYHHRRGMGAAWGGVTGLVVGLVIGPLLVVPIEAFPSLIVASH